MHNDIYSHSKAICMNMIFLQIKDRKQVFSFGFMPKTKEMKEIVC